MSYTPPTDENAILMMRFSAIAYDSPAQIGDDVTNANLIPPSSGSWKCTWGPAADSVIAIEALAFIAREASSNEYAVVIRGTTPSSLTDWHFDLDTWPLDPLSKYLPGAPDQLETAMGTLGVFCKIITLCDANDTILDYFKRLETPPSRVFVTGHSLGGTVATLVALWLKAQFAAITNLAKVVVQPYTFAAFTPGNQALADHLDTTFGNGSGLAEAWRYYNVLDVAPVLWTSLPEVQALYSYKFEGTGPSEISTSFGKIPATAGQVYYQPQQGGFALEGRLRSEPWIGIGTEWDRETEYQHSHTVSYLPLMLGQPQPVVSVSAAAQT